MGLLYHLVKGTEYLKSGNQSYPQEELNRGNHRFIDEDKVYLDLYVEQLIRKNGVKEENKPEISGEIRRQQKSGGNDNA